MNRTLAEGRPGKHRYSLACSLGTLAELLSQAERRDDALAAASEAARIYQDVHPGSHAASEAAEVLALHGQLLCEASRYREAAQHLARGWRLADSRDRHNPGFGRAALKTAYDADPPVSLAYGAPKRAPPLRTGLPIRTALCLNDSDAIAASRGVLLACS